MKVSVLQQDLSPLVSTASHFVAMRAQLPILANIKLVADKARLQIQATNLEMAISSSIGAKMEATGEIAIPAKTFADLVATLPQGQVEFESANERLSVTAESVSATVSGMNTADFPEISSEIHEPFAVFPTKQFLTALNKVLFATSFDDTRPQLTGVLLSVDNGLLRLVSTDGFRLSKVDVPVDVKESLSAVIIPRSVLTELVKLSKASPTISYSYDEPQNQIQFQIGETLLSSKIIAGTFPPYEKHIPESYKVRASASKKDLSSAIKTAAVFARENANLITFSLGENSIIVSATSPQSGEQKGSVDAKVEGGSVTIVYNYRYLEEVLNVIEGESVIMEFQNNLSTGVIKDSSDEHFLHLVMPVKS
ncbi:DNA polymerase III subunit beta [Candidatus Woesebacteria bacterium RIFCSPHIGHO2_01_FULL_41_10]|uniref:Beta sliding clamp n=1 Tax=Candidatus Woesebacteria bacterium RIFCSPHIGHO2_01_FULL_41_10 TaxID=1802500 RepID=A0A1F7YMQ3_9BACT|nr:MAG: DNA polymerase III subunit beta [Candidatus Woesebacteria bacterium RIFCSPHIGHO2_01_FULL_41_10]